MPKGDGRRLCSERKRPATASVASLEREAHSVRLSLYFLILKRGKNSLAFTASSTAVHSEAAPYFVNDLLIGFIIIPRAYDEYKIVI